MYYRYSERIISPNYTYKNNKNNTNSRITGVILSEGTPREAVGFPSLPRQTLPGDTILNAILKHCLTSITYT